MRKYFAFCWASGLIQFADKVPAGAIQLCCGARTTVVREVTVAARHGVAGQLLVPGVVEASTETLKADALAVFLAWLAGGRASRFITWASSGNDAKFRDPAVVERVRRRLDRDVRRQLRMPA